MAPIMAARVGVRRNAVITFTPTSLSGLALWLDAGQITGAMDGAAVATWQDRSGNARDATQATSSKQPIYRSTGALITSSSKPVVQFDGVDDGLFTVSMGAGARGNATFFMVGNFTRANSGINPGLTFTDGSAVYEGAVGLGRVANSTLGGANSYDSSIHESLSTVSVLNAHHCISATLPQSTTGTLSGFVDGVANTPSTNSGGFGAYGSILYGVGSVGTSGSSQVSLAEVVSYNRILSTVERQQVEAYLKTKYGTP